MCYFLITGCIHYSPEQGVVLEVGFTKFFKNLGKYKKPAIKNQKWNPVNQENEREKKVQLKAGNVDGAEDKTVYMICAQSSPRTGLKETWHCSWTSFFNSLSPSICDGLDKQRCGENS
jgi:hypothetical protein